MRSDNRNCVHTNPAPDPDLAIAPSAASIPAANPLPKLPTPRIKRDASTCPPRESGATHRQESLERRQSRANKVESPRPRVPASPRPRVPASPRPRVPLVPSLYRGPTAQFSFSARLRHSRASGFSTSSTLVRLRRTTTVSPACRAWRARLAVAEQRGALVHARRDDRTVAARRHHHRAKRQAVRADRRDAERLDVGADDRPARRDVVGGRPAGGRDDHAVAEVAARRPRCRRRSPARSCGTAGPR